MGCSGFRGTLVHLADFRVEYGSTDAVPPVLYVPNRVPTGVQLALQMVHLAVCRRDRPDQRHHRPVWCQLR